MDIQAAIRQLVAGQDLSDAEASHVMREIMTGQCTDAQIGAFLVAQQIKGVATAELLGAARVMRELATPVQLGSREHLVDTCGTGGTGTNTFNISTASAMVAACAGARVAKHGNRGATSKSGSADVLEQAGVNLSISAEQVAQCLDELGVGFMFAPGHHSAMKHVIGPRKQIGVRSIFNMLGPLTNPAGAPNQVMGVFDAVWIQPVLEVLKGLGSDHVLVLASEDGLDEISTAATTHVGELKDGVISTYEITPEMFGMPLRSDYQALQVESPEQSLVLLRQALANENLEATDIVALNAGAAIYAANLTDDLSAGVEKAKSILASGAALQKLNDLATLTRSFSE
ncbi:anthranilate phosphoribosyltransferase [Pseudohongiella nitratireducens]|uniref:Anthranilate phosphoribosyltransferase n=1 Tax=Pseudohongiella nitratireducens TaxID=1768907 RepID=A0A916QIS0_9GAMM|nr:anthranilate phosphoribosyltransferase [Pseudohongiella nitratireducens]MDF1622263.1 anthranilate phosphoribosyltransferase [Pseudohongiella nitratireducens]GFZ76054.1 anthranilate phosphoribosyltransferase [Pseudohongiella nitratireducens]|tara:strand:+ start:5855 stop:6883 length:1029 start_codon:yes stop_codon:yes gene_type:complete